MIILEETAPSVDDSTRQTQKTRLYRSYPGSPSRSPPCFMFELHVQAVCLLYIQPVFFLLSQSVESFDFFRAKFPSHINVIDSTSHLFSECPSSAVARVASCFNEGTRSCPKCKMTWYCSQACQQAHLQKHRKHCTAHKPMPAGTYDFLRLPREIRNKVELITPPSAPGLLVN